MDATWKAIIWKQFGASIDMLENAIRACPEKVWGDRKGWQEFWYLAFHTLFWLDLYLSESHEGFTPPQPFGLEELDPAGLLPDRIYAKDELLSYLEHGRRKCRAAIQALTDETAYQFSGSKGPDLTNAELLLYNMRHVQHHAAQLNLILRQTVNSAPQWVGQAKRKLSRE